MLIVRENIPDDIINNIKSFLVKCECCQRFYDKKNANICTTCNDLSLKGAGIHRILNNGYLQFHTDFNTYYKNNVKRDKKIHLDRRINLLLYMNPEWKDEYNGHLMLCDKDKKQCVKKILPILNRCVIFNTTNRSIHGHPKPLNVPPGIERNSIAIYYYTKNDRDGVDFEGDKPHSTIWCKNIKDL